MFTPTVLLPCMPFPLVSPFCPPSCPCAQCSPAMPMWYLPLSLPSVARSLLPACHCLFWRWYSHWQGPLSWGSLSQKGDLMRMSWWWGCWGDWLGLSVGQQARELYSWVRECLEGRWKNCIYQFAGIDGILLQGVPLAGSVINVDVGTGRPGKIQKAIYLMIVCLFVMCQEPQLQQSNQGSLKYRIESMMNRALHFAIIYILRLKDELRRLSLVWLLILPVQLLMLMLFCMQANLLTHPDDFIGVTIHNVFNALNSEVAADVFIYLSFALGLVLMTSFTAFVALKKPMTELDRLAGLFNKLVTLSSVLIYVLELGLFCIAWHYNRKIAAFFNNNGPAHYFYLFLVSIVSLVFVLLINNRMRLLSYFSFILVFIINEDYNINVALSLISIGFGVYCIKTDENSEALSLMGHNLRQILHLVLMAFFLWKLVDHLLIEKLQKQDSYISYIYLGIYLLVSLAIGFIQFTSPEKSDLPALLRLCEWLKIQEADPNDIESQMSLLETVNELFKELEKKKSISAELFELRCKKHTLWKAEDWQMLINYMIKEMDASGLSMQKSIDILKCMIIRKEKNILEVIQRLKSLIIKYKNQGISSLYEILKITLKIQDAYLKQHHTTSFPVAHIVREVDRLNQKFYKDCTLQVKRLYQFWGTVITYKIRLDERNHEISTSKQPHNLGEEGEDTAIIHAKEKMEGLIVSIHKNVGKLEDTLADIEKISSAKREHRALECIKFVATYSHEHQEQEKGASGRDSGFLLGDNNPRDFSEYLQIIDSRISRISFKLAAELGYKKIEIINQKIKALIPSIYEKDMERAIFNNTEANLKIPYAIPVICCDESIVLKRVHCFLELDFELGHRILMHFNDNNMNVDPILMYNMEKNMIEYYNKAFVDCFKIDQAKLNSKIKSSLLNPDEIFKDFDLGEKNTQNKLIESGQEAEYNCRMNVQDMTQKKSARFENVRISLIEKEKGYMILKVMKGYRMKSTLGDSKINKAMRSQAFSNMSLLKIDSSMPSDGQGRQSKTPKKRDENAIFCKIENPYESKINVKKIELGKHRKFTLKFYAVSLILLATLLLVVESGLYIHLNNDTNHQFSLQSSQCLSVIKQYSELMSAYQNHYNYKIIRHAESFIRQVSNDYEQLLAETAKKIEEEVNNFENEYLGSFLYSGEINITYGVQFKYFNVTTDTTTTNLLDFSQNMLLYGNEDSLQFLVRNYPTFVALSQRVIRENSVIFSPASAYMKTELIVAGVSVAISVIFLLISTILTLKIANIKADVQLMFKLMHKNSIDQVFQALSTLRKSFLELNEYGVNEEQRYKKVVEAYVHSRKNIEASTEIDQHDQRDGILETNQLELDEKQLSKSQKKQKRHEAEAKQEASKEDDKIEGGVSSSKLKVITIYGTVLILISMGIITFCQASLLITKLDDRTKILQFKMQNRLITQNFIQQILQAQHFLVSQGILNIPYNYEQSRQVSLINNNRLPSEFFRTYIQNYFKKVSGDLCDTVDSFERLNFSRDQCLKVGNGYFHYGVARTIERVKELLLESTKREADFWFTVEQGHELPRVQEVFFSQEMVAEISQENEEELQIYMVAFQAQLDRILYLVFLLGCGLTAGLLGVLYWTRKQIYRVSRITVGYFLIMPKKIMLQNEILDHLRKRQILNRLSSV